MNLKIKIAPNVSPIPQSIVGYVGKLLEIKRYAKSARDQKRPTAILNVQ